MNSYRRLLVTGHLGFIASEFCAVYRNRYEIAGVDFGGWGSMEENLVSGVKDIRADIADAARVRSIVDDVQPDAIVNFAAESHVDRANEDDSCFWRSNVLGARNLALEAMRKGIRLVHVSTDEVYGDATMSSEPWTERSPIAPKNPYAVTKAAAEMLLHVYSESRRGLNVVITRGANTVGPRQFPEKAIPKAVSCFIQGRPFPLYATPARRMWMHVSDHASGVEAALQRGARGEVYNLAPPFASEAQTSEVIERILRLVGQGTIETVEDREHYDLRYWMDASKAKDCLGWEAKYGLEETIESTVDWYLANPSWLRTANRKAALDAWLPQFISGQGAVSGTVHLHEDGVLKLAAAVNIPQKVREVVAIVPNGKGMAGLALQHGEPVHTCNLKEDATGSVKPGAKAVDAQAAVAIPVRDKTGFIYAVVGVAFRQERQWTGEELRRLTEAASDLPDLR
jgi:dTDP-glucose 4,6-dehydratase